LFGLGNFAAAMVQEAAARGVWLQEHPAYYPNMTQADSIYFRKMKKELAGRPIAAGNFKKTWEGVSAKLQEGDFAAAFRRRLDRC